MFEHSFFFFSMACSLRTVVMNGYGHDLGVWCAMSINFKNAHISPRRLDKFYQCSCHSLCQTVNGQTSRQWNKKLFYGLEELGWWPNNQSTFDWFYLQSHTMILIRLICQTTIDLGWPNIRAGWQEQAWKGRPRLWSGQELGQFIPCTVNSKPFHCYLFYIYIYFLLMKR